MKLVALVVASLLGLSTAASADVGADVGPPVAAYADYTAPPPRARPITRVDIKRAIVARFDRDGDGRLNPRERREAARALRRMAKKLARNERRSERGEGRDARGPGPRDVQVDVTW